MREVRGWLLMLGLVSAAAYTIYDVWLASIIEPVPTYVWELAAWTWTFWVAWFGLQRFAR